jgi:MoaA/NifB/PqqE/SkfB family radical SAM enzyme
MKFVRLPHVVFETTSECNHNCRYCYNIWKRPGASAQKPIGFRQTLHTLKSLFRQAEVSHITFSGGEPFMSERFLDLVLTCRMKRKSVTIITNGTYARKEDYRSLKEIGVGMIELPILSAQPEVHDRLTGRIGSWIKVMQSAAIVQELGLPLVAVVVLTRLNYPGIGETIDLSWSTASTLEAAVYGNGKIFRCRSRSWVVHFPWWTQKPKNTTFRFLPMYVRHSVC